MFDFSDLVLACVLSAIAAFLATIRMCKNYYQEQDYYVEVYEDFRDVAKQLNEAADIGVKEYSIELIDQNCTVSFVQKSDRERLEELI